MSNSSGTAGDTLAALSDSYFQWLEKDVFPILIGICRLVILILGVTINSVVINAFVKKRVTILSSTILFWQLVVIDFTAYVCIIFPGIIAAFSKSWILSDLVCTISGVVNTLCFLLTFIFLTILIAEKSVNLFHPNIHSATFENKKLSAVVCILTWIFCLLGSLMPTLDWGVIKFITFESKCALVHSKNRMNLILLLTFGLFIPFAVTFGFIIAALVRRKELLSDLKPLNKKVNKINEKVDEKSSKEEPVEMQDLVNGRSGSTSYHSIDGRTLTASDILVRPPSGNRVSPTSKDSARTLTPTTSRSEKEMQQDIAQGGMTRNKKRLNALNVAMSVFSSSVEHNHFHFAVTFTLIWITVFCLWFPYVMLLFIDIFDVATVWNGWFSIASILCDVTYCIKPIVFLSHNRSFRKAAVKTVPETLRKRAVRATKVLQRTLRRADEMIFVHVNDDTEKILEEGEIEKQPVSPIPSTKECKKDRLITEPSHETQAKSLISLVEVD